jgi:hypothetical protein
LPWGNSGNGKFEGWADEFWLLLEEEENATFPKHSLHQIEKLKYKITNLWHIFKISNSKVVWCYAPYIHYKDNRIQTRIVILFDTEPEFRPEL